MKKLIVASIGCLGLLAAPVVDAGGYKAVSVPMTCSEGDANQTFWALLTIPPTATVGSKFTVTIAGVNSGLISHTGLNYIYNMETDFPVPAGTKFVAGSAKILPDTGTKNVRDGATAWMAGGVVHTRLPGHVENDTTFTAPTLEFQLEVTGKVGDKAPVTFSQYRVTANAFVVGDVKSVCDPKTKPHTMGNVTVAAP